jgi:Golgi apparatus protein 1
MIVRLLLAALAALPLAARAEDPCAAEVHRLCPRSRGDVETLSCLRANERELSRACKGDLDAVLAKARAIGAACEGDVYKLCKDVAPGEGRVAACLKAHEGELSQGCQGAFNTWRLARMELTAACAGDVGRFCRDVPEGGGRIWTCLKEHLPELTSDCRSAVNKL